MATVTTTADAATDILQVILPLPPKQPPIPPRQKKRKKTPTTTAVSSNKYNKQDKTATTTVKMYTGHGPIWIVAASYCTRYEYITQRMCGEGEQTMPSPLPPLHTHTHTHTDKRIVYIVCMDMNLVVWHLHLYSNVHTQTGHCSYCLVYKYVFVLYYLHVCSKHSSV